MANFLETILSRTNDQEEALILPDQTYSYGQLIVAIGKIAASLYGVTSVGELKIGILSHKGIEHLGSLLAVMSLGCVAVPLCTMHPIPELLYSLTDSTASALIYSKPYSKVAEELKSRLPLLKVYCIEDMILDSGSTEIAAPIPPTDLRQGCLIIYTSGSTGNPKGAIHTIGSLSSQIESLNQAWNITSKDRILHVLPVHHIHGIVNAMLCILTAGGSIIFRESFDSTWVLTQLYENSAISLFMAVPTIYSKLLKELEKSQDLDSSNFKHIRLMISGSAALPSPIRVRWHEKTGHLLLERYGMTEIGMALSCGLDVKDRIDSSVGHPLPGVLIKLVDVESGLEIDQPDQAGEIYVKSDNLFREYYNRPEQTMAEFKDGWFKTGDIALRSSSHNNAYFIQGRNSVDIIKSGGYKISALEVEKEILALEGISECAVIGIPCPEWGQRVAAIISSSTEISLDFLRSELKKKVAVYKVPSLLKQMDTIPRNAIGKVNKKDLAKIF